METLTETPPSEQQIELVPHAQGVAAVRRDRIGVAALVVALAALLLAVAPRVVALNQGGRAVMRSVSAVQVLRFEAGAGDQIVRAEYEDAQGVQADAPAGSDIQVRGLKWAAVAVSGQDVDCAITLNGITEAAQGSVDPAGIVDVCVYSAPQ